VTPWGLEETEFPIDHRYMSVNVFTIPRTDEREQADRRREGEIQTNDEDQEWLSTNLLRQQTERQLIVCICIQLLQLYFPIN